VLEPRQDGSGFAAEARALDVELDGATGLVASDVDGDGIVDLVVADAGSLRVLSAELEP
jgi:hypothetical protein